MARCILAATIALERGKQRIRLLHLRKHAATEIHKYEVITTHKRAPILCWITINVKYTRRVRGDHSLSLSLSLFYLTHTHARTHARTHIHTPRWPASSRRSDPVKGLGHTPCLANGLRPEAANGIMSLQQPGVTFLATGAWNALNGGHARTHTSAHKGWWWCVRRLYHSDTVS